MLSLERGEVKRDRDLRHLSSYTCPYLLLLSKFTGHGRPDSRPDTVGSQPEEAISCPSLYPSAVPSAVPSADGE